MYSSEWRQYRGRAGWGVGGERRWGLRGFGHALEACAVTGGYVGAMQGVQAVRAVRDGVGGDGGVGGEGGGGGGGGGGCR